MNGYQGKLLIADLTKGTLQDEPLNEKYARDFIGSTGLAARYLFDMVDEKTDPLGPDNPLILMTGQSLGRRHKISLHRVLWRCECRIMVRSGTQKCRL